MKKLALMVSLLIVLAVVPSLTLAHCGSCDHQEKGGTKQAASHQGHGDHQGHGGMGAAGGIVELGSMSAKGIKGAAQIKDVRAAMAKMGMKTTHHFMVTFHDQKSGKLIESGTVAVKINDPDGVSTGPIELKGMQGHFGADVTLAKKGEYHFIIGARLSEGEPLQFHYHAVIK